MNLPNRRSGSGILTLVVAVGYLMLGVASWKADWSRYFLQDPPIVAGAFMTGGLLLALWWHGGDVLRKTTAAVAVGYGAYRGMTWAFEGVWNAFWVWWIVVILSVIAYRSGEGSGSAKVDQ